MTPKSYQHDSEDEGRMERLVFGKWQSSDWLCTVNNNTITSKSICIQTLSSCSCEGKELSGKKETSPSRKRDTALDAICPANLKTRDTASGNHTSLMMKRSLRELSETNQRDWQTTKGEKPTKIKLEIKRVSFPSWQCEWRKHTACNNKNVQHCLWHPHSFSRSA